MSKFKKIFVNQSSKSIKWSNYFEIYDQLFVPYVGKPITFVEIGVLNGGSLLMWKEFFGPKSRIIGIDNNPQCKSLEQFGNFEIIIGDQASPEFWKSLKTKNIKIDILLDDGGHTNKQQINTLRNSLDLVNDGGLIVVEDTHASYMREFGNPSKYSFIEYCKILIDTINSRYIQDPRSKFAASVYSIEFFESIVCFRISRQNSIKNSRISNQPKKNTEKVNFRNKGTINNILRVQFFQPQIVLKIFRKLNYIFHIFVIRKENYTLKQIFRKND